MQLAKQAVMEVERPALDTLMVKRGVLRVMLALHAFRS
jgi:hypothetical protein